MEFDIDVIKSVEKDKTIIISIPENIDPLCENDDNTYSFINTEDLDVSHHAINQNFAMLPVLIRARFSIPLGIYLEFKPTYTLPIYEGIYPDFKTFTYCEGTVENGEPKSTLIESTIINLKINLDLLKKYNKGAVTFSKGTRLFNILFVPIIGRHTINPSEIKIEKISNNNLYKNFLDII